MEIITKINELREHLKHKSIGFVPTMGALHEGHLTLMRQAKLENDLVLVSIFVNPTQFNDAKDLAKYPRDLKADCEMCAGVGVDIVFAPNAEEMYPRPMATIVDVPLLSSGLIGKLRPGHFQGMASVVIKLLNIAGATRAYFGEKDYQQLAIIKHMVNDLNIPTEIIGVPIVREKDGLAMSSRNMRLRANERKAAAVIYQSIIAAQKSNKRDVTKLIKLVKSVIETEPLATIKSIDIVDALTLEPLTTIDRKAALLLNVQFGDIILIDQVILNP